MTPLPLELLIFIGAMISAGVLSLWIGTRRIRKREPGKTLDAYGLQAEGVGFLLGAPIIIAYPRTVWSWGLVVFILLAAYTIGMWRGSRALKAHIENGKSAR